MLFIRLVGVSDFPRVQSTGRVVLLWASVRLVFTMGCEAHLSVCRSLRVPVRRWAMPVVALWVPANRFVCFPHCPKRGWMLLVRLFVIVRGVVWDVMC